MNTKKKPTSRKGSRPQVSQLHPNTTAAQRARVLRHLRAYRALTTLEARRLLDVMHPAARVMELRKQGFQILTNWKYDLTSEGGKHRVAEYVLMAEQEAAA